MDDKTRKQIEYNAKQDAAEKKQIPPHQSHLSLELIAFATNDFLPAMPPGNQEENELYRETWEKERNRLDR